MRPFRPLSILWTSVVLWVRTLTRWLRRLLARSRSTWVSPVADVLSPVPKLKFFDNAGKPLVGGKLFTYAAGTSTKIATYVDSAGVTPNSNPIVLDYRGECDCWIPPNVAYKYTLAPSNDTDPPTNPLWSVDNLVSSQLVTLYGGVDTGTADSYVINFSSNFTTLTDGLVIYWVASNTNTLSSSLNVNGLGAAPLVNFDGTALIANQIVAGQIYEVMYLTGSWRVLNSAPLSGSFTGTMTGITTVQQGTCRYTVSGRIVALRIPQISGVSNSVLCSITGMPTFLGPNFSQTVAIPAVSFFDNSLLVNDVNAVITSAFPGEIRFQKNGSVGGFTAAGAKGMGNEFTLVWELQ